MTDHRPPVSGEPTWCEIHQHHKPCGHNGGIMGTTGYEWPASGEPSTEAGRLLAEALGGRKQAILAIEAEAAQGAAPPHHTVIERLDRPGNRANLERVSEREECGYCSRTESEGHAPTCPDRAASPAALDVRCQQDDAGQPCGRHLERGECSHGRAAWPSALDDLRLALNVYDAMPVHEITEETVRGAEGRIILAAQSLVERAASPAALDVERLRDSLQAIAEESSDPASRQLAASMLAAAPPPPPEAASPAAPDVEAISETMWLNRHLLDAGTTGASRSAYRKVAKQIAARLTEQEERG